MARRRPTQKQTLPALVILVIVLIGFFVPLPEWLLDALPPDIAQVLRRDPTPMAHVDPGSLPNTAKTFGTAKEWLYEKVYADRPKTFYCGCDYSADRQVDLSSCGLDALADVKRAQRIEVEHAFPAYQFGNFRPCWREPEKICGEPMSGRECCQKADPVFIAAHNDLHNLYPTVGEINGRRRHYNWGMIEGERRQFGTCNIEVDPQIRRAEPPDTVWGDIARTMLYMSETYQFRLSDQDRQLYAAWNNLDPPDEWEIERNRRISAIQGQGNRFVEHYERLEP